MYIYNEPDRALLAQRTEQFAGQVNRYLAGELAEDEFQQLRLRNGLYMELHAPMLRVAIPYGLLSSGQLRALARVARTYDRGYGHFTTRQNIQFNWPKLEQVPQLLADLSQVEMHAIQTSGSVVRNITSDPLAGVAADEIEDPRPWCELLRQWSTLHPEFNWLPRKFKIAVTGARNDRAAVRFHDIGLQVVDEAGPNTVFRVWVGGGLGRSPFMGQVIHERLPGTQLLNYVEAILRIYNLEGRRDNKHKARIKILVNALGIDVFKVKVDSEWALIQKVQPGLSGEIVEQMRAHFVESRYDPSAPGKSGRLTFDCSRNADFARWVAHNTTLHRVPGYRIIYASLKAPGAAPGDLGAKGMEALAGFAERYSFGEIRASHEQNLLLAHVREADLYDLWQGLRIHRLATPNIGTLTDMICCPGADYCSLAHASSLDVASMINQRFDDLDHLYDLGDISLKMSGCINACGHHHLGHIGILGVKKRDEHWYQLTLGGAPGNDGAIGKRLGPAFSADEIVEAIERILRAYLAWRRPRERFIDTWRRLGNTPFKEAVYGDTHHRTDTLAA
ncbi:MAG: nitrite/sulfite reductase [Acidiferrobacteraceae bacterium]|nr:nitrite/sulfite reductase [Acidiferrobacteraceae bacterium]